MMWFVFSIGRHANGWVIGPSSNSAEMSLSSRPFAMPRRTALDLASAWIAC